jgi:glycine/serine hydroxymethyltransferase
MQAMTTRWVKEDDTRYIAKLIHETIQNRTDEDKLNTLHNHVIDFCSNFPIPSI